MLKEKRNTSIFAKKLNKFLSHNWEQPLEKELVQVMRKYKSKMEADEEQGKQYLQKMFDANVKLIESNASTEFQKEFSNLVNEYKTDEVLDTETVASVDKSKMNKPTKDKTTEEDKPIEESEDLNELQDQTKYFNKKQKKLYSDQPYIAENKNLMITRQNLDDFFSIIDNENAQYNWEQYTKKLSESVDLQDDFIVANGIINSLNLNKRAQQFFGSLGESLTVKENYLYRPTGDYKYKVKLHMNPYADKESCIYFDDKTTAEKYANDSKGKYEYIGTESLKEGLNKNTVELLIEKLKKFDWYGNLNSTSLNEAKIYVTQEKEIKKLVESCGSLGIKIYNKYCPWKKVESLKEDIGNSEFTLNKDSVGYNTNPMNTAIHEDESFDDWEDDGSAGAENKKFQLFYMYMSGDELSKDWYGGYDSFEQLKREALVSWIDIEKEKAEYERREPNLKPKLNNQGLPVGFIFEENNSLNEHGSRANQIARKGKVSILDSEDKLEEGPGDKRQFQDDDFEDEEDYDISDEVSVGDYVDFGQYGKLYVNRKGLDKWRVTDQEENRTDPYASGWNISPRFAKKIIEKYESDSYLDESLTEDHEQLETIEETDQIADDVLFDSDELNEKVRIKNTLQGLYESIKKKINEDLDTEAINLRITPKYDKSLPRDIINKIASILNRNFNISSSQIKVSTKDITVKRVPLELYVEIDQTLKKLSNELVIKNIGHYSDEKYFDVEKSMYTEMSRSEQKAKTGKSTVLDCDLRMNEDTYAEYMEDGEEVLEESEDFTCEELGEDNENKKYLDKVNDEAHKEPYENWQSLTDDEDPDKILFTLTEADVNSSESKGKLYRFTGASKFMQQFLYPKLDGYNINYNPVSDTDENGKNIVEVDVYQDDLEGTGLSIQQLDDWLEDRSFGDWEDYRHVKEVNDVNYDEIDFRGTESSANEGPLTDNFRFLGEELSHDFSFLKEVETINQPEYKYYVVSLSQNKIVSGWEFSSDARDYVKEMEDSLGVLKIFTSPKLLKAGLNPKDNKSWGTDILLNETTTTASIAVPDIPAFSNTDLKTKMVDPVKQTKLTEGINKDINNPNYWIGKTLTLDLRTWWPNMPEDGSYNADNMEEEHWYMNEQEWNKFYSLLKKGSKAKVINAYNEGGYDSENNKPSDDAQPIEGFKWSLQFVEAPELNIDPAGDGMGFDTYPREIEQVLGYNRDYYFKKIKVYTKGKNIKESIMKNKEQLIKETLENLHKEVLKEETFDASKAPNLANSLNTSYKKADKENSDSKFDPYKGASNVVKGSKTQVKKKNSILESDYRIKNYNVKDKGLTKFSVIVENGNAQREVVSFDKKDFAKFIFENCNTRQYLREGKFDYFSYINSKPYAFINTLLESYFASKFKQEVKQDLTEVKYIPVGMWINLNEASDSNFEMISEPVSLQEAEDIISKTRQSTNWPKHYKGAFKLATSKENAKQIFEAWKTNKG